MNPASPCYYLEWDSEFFQRRLARLEDGALTPERLARVEDWCRRERIEGLYYLAEAADTDSLHLAEQNHFRLVDLRLTLVSELTRLGPESRLPDPVVIRPAQPGDIPALRVLAGANHEDTRFFHDRHFPRERSRDLYALWIEKSCRGEATVLVAANAEAPLGYITMLEAAPGRGQIGLCGVAASARGMGLGRGLVAAAQRWFREQGLAQAVVVTQGRNLAATRLYERGGFITEQLQLWFHRWFEPAYPHRAP